MEDVFIHELMAYPGLKIYQKTDSFRFSLDALLLGDFVEFNSRDKKLLELGSGNGAILLYLSLKTKIELNGIDIQEDAVNLAQKSVELNGLDKQINVKKLDIKEAYKYFSPSSFDLIVSNPPFFKVNDLNLINKKENLSLARHEISLSFKDLLEATKKLLKTGGSFFFIHRANRLDEIIVELKKENFVIKKIRFVYTKIDKDALMVLIEARFNGKIGSLKVVPPLYIYDELGNYTKEVLKVFHLGDDNFE